MSRWFKHIAILLIFTLALGACSRVGLAYRNLDVIIPWTLSDYLDINGEQKDWFNERLKKHLNWHCTTQLPGYLEWLDRLQSMVETNQVTDAALQARTTEAKMAIAETARQITPSAIELLQGLDDKQVAEMNDAFAKDLRKREKEYVKPPLAQQIAERGARMDKRLTDWLGPLSVSQEQRVMAWSTALGDQNTQWIANRATGRNSSARPWRNVRAHNSHNKSRRFWSIEKVCGHRNTARPSPTPKPRRARYLWI